MSSEDVNTPYRKSHLSCFNDKTYLNTANKYLLKVNNKNTGKRCEICSGLTIKTPAQRH